MTLLMFFSGFSELQVEAVFSNGRRAPLISNLVTFSVGAISKARCRSLRKESARPAARFGKRCYKNVGLTVRPKLAEGCRKWRLSSDVIQLVLKMSQRDGQSNK